MNNLSIILGKRLLTIGDVVSGTGLSRGTVSDIYHRKADKTKVGTLIKICDYLQIPLSDLIEYTPKELTKEA